MQRNRGFLGEPVADRAVIPEDEHQPDRRRERVTLADSHRAGRTRGRDEFEQRDAVVDDTGQGRGDAEGIGERTQFSLCRGAHPQGLLRGVSQRDQGGAEPVGLVPGALARLAHEVARLGQAGQDSQAGGLAEVDPTGQFGESEAVMRVRGQKVQHCDHPFGGWGRTSGRLVRHRTSRR